MRMRYRAPEPAAVGMKRLAAVAEQRRHPLQVVRRRPRRDPAGARTP